MAKYLGRKVIIAKGATPIANVRTKSLSINRELVDSSDDDSGAWATHLDEPGQIDVSISVEGVISDHAILGESLNPVVGNAVYTLTYPDGGVVSGTFGLSSFSLEDTYNDLSTYSFEMRASGPVTYTAGP
jgi:TP901-1 family phage major tail protein